MKRISEAIMGAVLILASVCCLLIFILNLIFYSSYVPALYISLIGGSICVILIICAVFTAAANRHEIGANYPRLILFSTFAVITTAIIPTSMIFYRIEYSFYYLGAFIGGMLMFALGMIIPDKKEVQMPVPNQTVSFGESRIGNQRQEIQNPREEPQKPKNNFSDYDL